MGERLMKGYNGAVIAYGQTGSGKTHTISGMQRRMIRHVCKLVDFERERTKQSTVQLHMACVEVYNDKVRDLLGNSRLVDVKTSSSSNSTADWSLSVRFPKLVWTELNRFEDSVMSLTKARTTRAVGRTSVHEYSSRSHAIYMYRVSIKVNEESKMSAVLFLVDLAGSERLKKSEATGVRKTETQHINKSLSALGDVCAALDASSSSSCSSSHIPYRNSKLTLLLKDALGGNTTTVLISTVSPENECNHESLCTLSFAQRCRNIDLKAVTANVRQRDMNTYLKQDMKRIKSQLSKAIEEREEFRERIIRHEKRFRESKDLLKSARRDLDHEKRELNALRSEVKTLRKVVSDLKDDARRAKTLIKKMSPRLTESKVPRSPPSSRARARSSSFSSTTSGTKVPSSRLRAPSSRLKASSSRLKLPASRLKTPASRLKTPASRLKTPASRLKTPASRLLKTPASRIPKPQSSRKSSAKPLWK